MTVRPSGLEWPPGERERRGLVADLANAPIPGERYQWPCERDGKLSVHGDLVRNGRCAACGGPLRPKPDAIGNKTEPMGVWPFTSGDKSGRRALRAWLERNGFPVMVVTASCAGATVAYLLAEAHP